jgi:hypothetical protein
VIRARLLALCANVFVILALVPPVAAAGTLTVTPTSGGPGEQLTASGTGVAGGEPVTLQWDGNTAVGQGSSTNDGTFSIQFTIPTSATPGGHQLRACIRSDCSIAPPFTVAVTTTPASAPPSTTPAPTGDASSTGPSGSPGSSGVPSEAPSAGTSESPTAIGSPAASEVPSGAASPDASASGAVVAPTLGPTAIAASPTGADPFSRVNVALPWLLLVGAVLGFLLLGLYVVLQRNDGRGVNGEAAETGDDEA